MSIQIHATPAVHTFFAVLNSVACAVLVIIRVYHWKKGETEVLKLSVTGFSCMFVALLCCLSLVDTVSETNFGDTGRWCGLSLKLNLATYSLHRVLLYIFIIFRLEFIDLSNFVSSRIINAGKIVIGIVGISMVVVTTISANGTANRYHKCAFEMRNEIVITFFVTDFLICAGGTWMFIRPLRKILRIIEKKSVRYMLEKTVTWSLVSLICTLITMLTIAVTNGAGGVIGFDCSITSFSLLMMMSPVRRKVRSKSEQEIVKVEMVDIGA